MKSKVECRKAKMGVGQVSHGVAPHESRTEVKNSIEPYPIGSKRIASCRKASWARRSTMRSSSGIDCSNSWRMVNYPSANRPGRSLSFRSTSSPRTTRAVSIRPWRATTAGGRIAFFTRLLSISDWLIRLVRKLHLRGFDKYTESTIRRTNAKEPPSSHAIEPPSDTFTPYLRRC